MLMNVLDATGVTQKIVVTGQESAIPSASGTIDNTGESQLLLDPNPLRSGWLMQNKGASPMYINEFGNASMADPVCMKVAPGEFFPPPGYPLTINEIQILGTTGEAFSVREW